MQNSLCNVQTIVGSLPAGNFFDMNVITTCIVLWTTLLHQVGKQIKLQRFYTNCNYFVMMICKIFRIISHVSLCGKTINLKLARGGALSLPQNIVNVVSSFQSSFFLQLHT